METPPAGTVWLHNREQPCGMQPGHVTDVPSSRVGVTPVARLGLHRPLQQSGDGPAVSLSWVLLKALFYLLNRNTKWQVRGALFPLFVLTPAADPLPQLSPVLWPVEPQGGSSGRQRRQDWSQ